MSLFTDTHKDGVDAMVYAPNMGGTQIDPKLATCHIKVSLFQGRMYVVHAQMKCMYGRNPQ